MKNLIRSGNSQALRLVGSAVALAAVLAGAGGIAAGQAQAAPYKGMFDAPQLAHRSLAVRGTPGNDKIAVRLKAGDAGVLQVDLGDDGSADFSFNRTEIAKIAVLALAGDDVVRIDELNGVFTDTIPTELKGGPGNDILAGGSGAEALVGGSGDDRIDGNRGDDVSAMGAGDDVFVWDPGDGSDTIQGQGGTDTMLFNGANAPEEVNLSEDGNHLKFVRSVGNATVTMDTQGVERVDFNALGGADVVTVNDLRRTRVTSVNIDLGIAGSGDGQVDRVVLNGTNGDDAIDVSGDAGEVKVSGLAPTVAIFHPEPNDRLEINTFAGTDTVDFDGLAAGTTQLFVDGVPVL